MFLNVSLSRLSEAWSGAPASTAPAPQSQPTEGHDTCEHLAAKSGASYTPSAGLRVPYPRSRKVLARAADQGATHSADVKLYGEAIKAYVQTIPHCGYDQLPGSEKVRVIPTAGFGNVGVAGARGVRNSMQDAVHAADYEQGSYVSLFDGHGATAKVAEKGVKIAPEMILEALKSLSADQREDPACVERIMKDTFAAKQTGFAQWFTWQIRNMATPSIQDVLAQVAENSGSTGLLALREGNDLFICNLSDSRCVMSMTGETHQLTVDQTVEVNEKKLEYLGAVITKDGPVKRADGLATGRVVGDSGARLVRRPQITHVAINAEARLAFVCDGILEVLSNEEIVDVINSYDKPENAAQELVRRAYAAGSQDNMSALVMHYVPVLPVPRG